MQYRSTSLPRRVVAYTDAHPWVSRLLLCILFAASVAARFLIADYQHTYNFYQDELIYGSYANTLLHDGELLLYGLPIGFFRPIYSLLIMPASMTSDPFARQVGVALINAVAVSSGVLPVWLLAQRVLRRRSLSLVAAAFFPITSDLVYSQAFMTEVAFLPLALWLVYVFYRLEALLRTASLMCRMGWGALLGALMCLCFMCKGGAALVFPVSYLLYLAMRWMRNGRLRERGARGGGKAMLAAFVDAHRARVYSLAAVAAGFSVVFIVFHLLIPPTSGDLTDMGNKLSLTSSPHEWLYFLYSAAIYLVVALLAFGFFPLVVGYQNRHRMEDGERRLYGFLAISLVTMAVTVALTISLKEDLFEPIPRTHLRYVMYLTAPLMIIFLREMTRRRRYSLPKNMMVTLVLVAILVGYLAVHLMFDVTLGGDLYDETTLKLLTDLPDQQVLSVAVICVLLVAGTVLLVRNRKAFAVAVVVVMCAVQVANGVLTSQHMREATEVSDEKRQQITLLLALGNSGDDKFLLLEGEGDKVIRANSVDTYMDYRRMYTVNRNDFVKTCERVGTATWESARPTLHPVRKDTVSYPDLSHVEYLIVPKRADISLEWDSFTEHYVYNEMSVDVYELSDPSRLPEIVDTAK